jgi:hypothetical protein
MICLKVRKRSLDERMVRDDGREILVDLFVPQPNRPALTTVGRGISERKLFLSLSLADFSRR